MDNAIKFRSHGSPLSPDERYAPPALFFHWAVALLIVIAYAAVIAKGYLPKGSAQRALSMTIHEWAGVMVLVLAVPRLLWRLIKGAPGPLPGQGWLVRASSGAVHLLLYLFLFAQPVLGYLTLNAGGHALMIPGLDIALPQFIGKDAELRRSIKDIHETIGNAFYWVIGLHALAALWHHYFRRDDTLRRML
ncbi:cytochrome b [Pandoraea apista]|uniref:Cytochrome b n=1 Tax=Pandoraea apista TaxID=93218 RepID=A0A5E5P0V1_9BURK|nr:cytochrome b [Pandoraea apista]AJE98763.1 cytochrome B561 [Pandoraea apista]AKH72838.1 cytochrome B561 [Pandoraea apista]AKI61224.1 cytochrome B561 [Pandoraea apista]ALS65709.1 cytochrome B [Pandoraea apista]AVF39430.1 cytochrome b [Pandoraea apista]